MTTHDTSGVGTFVNESNEMGSISLDLFTSPVIESALVHGKTITIYPSSVLTSEGPHQFVFPTDTSDYTHLPLTRLEGEFEIVKNDGSALVQTDYVSIVNLFPQSLFKQLEVHLHGQCISDLSTGI